MVNISICHFRGGYSTG